MPNQDPKIQAALAELANRGVRVNVAVPDPGPAPMIDPSAITPAAPEPATPTPVTVQAADVQPIQATGVQPAPDYSSPRDVERQLRLKQMKGGLAIQDAVNELNRRKVNVQLRTAPQAEEVITTQANEAAENARRQGDPEAFRNAWRALFPGKPLPRTPNGQIDYAGGQDDIDVELDRKKKLEAAKVGARGIKEVKTTRLDPATGKEQEVLIRYDEVSGNKLSEMILSENRKPVSKEQGDALKFADLMAQSSKTLDSIEAQGFDPSSIGSTVQRMLPNRFRSPTSQAYESSKDAWIAAHLRDVSGAAISNPEYGRAREQFFPKDGDAPEEVKRKQALRHSVEQSVRKIAGTAGASTEPAAPAPTPVPGATPAPSTAPVDVKSAAEAPPTAQFIRSPSGRVYRNPKYTGQ